MSNRAVTVPVVVDYLLSHLGFFALMPVLPLVVGRLVPDGSGLFIGVALFVFTFAMRGASLFFATLLHRMPVRRAMSGGLLVAAIAFALLAVAPHPAAIVVLLAVAGTGINVNGLMARVFVAKCISDPGARNTVFSAVQVAVNVSAAIGPVVANLVLGHEGETPLLLGVAATYVVTSAVVALTVPGGLTPRDGDVRPPLRWGIFAVIWRDRDVRRASLITAAGSFLYAQFFSAVVLHVASVTDEPLLRASVFTLNAILVVVVQIPVAIWARRALRRGVAPVRLMGVGVAVFAASFAALGGAGQTLVGTLVAIAIFSLAETVFTPMVHTAFASLREGRSLVEVNNLRQVAATAGESTGSFAGGALFVLAAGHGAIGVYWGALAVLGAAACLPYLIRTGKES